MRYDRAIVNTTEKIDGWIIALADLGDSQMLTAETASELADSYGDLLDIDGSLLSSSFLKDLNNLKLLKEAVEGNEESYNNLQEAARKNIAFKLNINDEVF
jgi:hypothetical protein